MTLDLEIKQNLCKSVRLSQSIDTGSRRCSNSSSRSRSRSHNVSSGGSGGSGGGGGGVGSSYGKSKHNVARVNKILCAQLGF